MTLDDSSLDHKGWKTFGQLDKKTVDAASLTHNYVWGTCAILGSIKPPFFDGRVTVTRYISDESNRITHAQKGLYYKNDDPKWDDPVPIAEFQSVYNKNHVVFHEEEYLDREKGLLQTLKSAFDQFCDIAWENPDNVNDFRRAIHECQRIVGLKFAAADHPNVFRKP